MGGDEQEKKCENELFTAKELITVIQKPCLFCQEESELEHELMKGRDVYQAPPTLPPRPCGLIPVEGYVTAFSGKNGPCSCFGSTERCIKYE